ncbi:hypothetical protein CDAR_551581 [Caerostris darwini]|uniref:Uncharacterized protein n=1 Tax=Caerostris darwini TaxID=1538125 RepID=A0AAV4V6G5_9ARAC|nr:hypothetical protein CDAR_551581 [Caerostris darwini]
MDHAEIWAIKLGHKTRALKRRKWLSSTAASSGSPPYENGLGLWVKVHGFGTYSGRIVEKSRFPCFTRLKVDVIRIRVDFRGPAIYLQERLTEAHKS